MDNGYLRAVKMAMEMALCGRGLRTIAMIRPVRSVAVRMMGGRGRPGIPYYECHGDGEGETGEERCHEDDGGVREARNTLL